MKTQTIFFAVPVSCQVPAACRVPFSDAYETYEDRGVLLLPETYCETGEPTRLVISCHGAGGTVYENDAQIIGHTLTKYLLANGYAVMDMAGLPLAFCEKYGIDPFNNIGGPIAMDAYERGYRYCTETYHLKKEVLLHGASMGGISSTNLVFSGRVPVLAQTGFCPVLDTYREIFLHPWSGGLPRTALGKLYALDADADGQYRYEEEKISPYNPMANPMREHYPVPVRFWQSVNDRTVSPTVTEEYVRILKENGADAALTLLPDGGHEPQDYGPAVENPAGSVRFDGAELKITEAVEGAFRFLTGFDR